MAEIGFGPLERIDGPLPIPPLYGLLPAAHADAAGVQIVPDTDDRGIERWMNGVEVYPYPPDEAEIWNACVDGSDGEEKVFGTDELDHPQYSALTIYLAETCTSFKVWNQEAFKARAVAALLAVEGAALAKEFLGGAEAPENPHLADGNGVFPNGNDPTSPINGLALLEEQIALSGKLGLIHCSPMLATSLLGRGFTIADRTGVIRTINGIPVIPDFGYAEGATPIGHPDATGTQEWAYATGPVDIRRTEMFVSPDNLSEALERGTPSGANTGRPNSITYRAERYYLIDWDTQVQAAVLIDRCQNDCVAA